MEIQIVLTLLFVLVALMLVSMLAIRKHNLKQRALVPVRARANGFRRNKG